MSLADTEATPAACNWVYPIIGILDQSPAQERGKSDILSLFSAWNSFLRSRTWLVGERMSLADVSLATSLYLVFEHCMDASLRSSLPHLTRWFTTVLGQNEVKEVLAQLNLKESVPKGAVTATTAVATKTNSSSEASP